MSMKILLLIPEAFGGHGGIAQYNQDLIKALSSLREIEQIVAVPRYISRPITDLPDKLVYLTGGAVGKSAFVRTCLGALSGRFDLVICGHINLLPLAWLSSLKTRAPLVLAVYGIDVWRRHDSSVTRWLLRRVAAIWSISECTAERMAKWADVPAERFCILPNAIDLVRYRMTSRDAGLIERYRLAGHKVMMILARLAATERYKGVDELLELMPELLEREPQLVFLVAGDGDDRPRLEAKAEELGVAERARFIGHVPEHEKVAHFQLADAFVMPGRGEGFGFVYLEAMACGVPVVASSLDGSREAVRFGMLGEVVDPDDRVALKDAITRALNTGKHIPKGMDFFSFENFRSRLQALVLGVTTKRNGMGI